MQKITQFNRWILLWVVAMILVLESCQTTKKDPAPQALVSARLIGQYTVADLDVRYRNIAAQSGALAPVINTFPSQLQNGVDVYRIVYRTTDVRGNSIQVSGAVLIPRISNPVGIVAQHHGTITNDADAPSYYNLSSEVAVFGTLVAANGFVVAAPDYIGYGVSNNVEHPYEHAATLAQTSLDMLRATRDLMSKQKVQWNNKLFLTGYSQGGGTTMALHKLIEERNSGEFTVTASAPGAGAYNKTAFARFIMNSNTNLTFLGTYVWVLDTYNKIYNLNRQFSQIFTEPNATIISQVPRPPLFASLTTISFNPQTLFLASFRNGILNGTDTAVLNAIADNNVFDWRPTAPIRMFHGTADDFVPIFNSNDALAAMNARGANQVTVVPIPGGNHTTSYPTYFLGALAYFNSLK